MLCWPCQCFIVQCSHIILVTFPVSNNLGKEYKYEMMVLNDKLHMKLYIYIYTPGQYYQCNYNQIQICIHYYPHLYHTFSFLSNMKYTECATIHFQCGHTTLQRLGQKNSMDRPKILHQKMSQIFFVQKDDSCDGFAPTCICITSIITKAML